MTFQEIPEHSFRAGNGYPNWIGARIPGKHHPGVEKITSLPTFIESIYPHENYTFLKKECLYLTSHL